MIRTVRIAQRYQIDTAYSKIGRFGVVNSNLARVSKELPPVKVLPR